jgi:hypothetical protein
VKTISNSVVRSFFVLFLAVMLPISQAHAGMISTERVVSDMSAERNRIADFLDRTEVKTKLVQWGVNPEEASQRVASLSDSEVRQIASRLDSLPVGGDGIYLGLGALVLIGILLILLLR